MKRTKRKSDILYVITILLTIPNSLIADHKVGTIENSSLETESVTKKKLSSECNNTTDSEEETEKLCETNEDSPPAFATQPITHFSIQIDIRPEDCGSFYDEYLPIRRGSRIESALNSDSQFSHYQETVSTFPVIDFINGNSAYIVKSKDLSAKTYNLTTRDGALFDSIISDAEDIETRIFNVLQDQESIEAKVNGEVTVIRQGQLDVVNLQIVIQAGIANNEQIRQIREAKVELYNRWGYILSIIEIP